MRAIHRLPIFTRASGRLPALAGDARGATLVEFGLFFPILALMALGTIDLGRGLAAKFALEQAAQRTIELATLGGRTPVDPLVLKAEAASAAGVPATNVTIDRWLECDNTRQTSWDGTCAVGQQTARYVQVSIFTDFVPNFNWLPITGVVATGANGGIRLQADAGVRVQ